MEYKSTYFISKDFFLVVLKQILFKIKKNKKPSYNILQTKFMDLKKKTKNFFAQKLIKILSEYVINKQC